MHSHTPPQPFLAQEPYVLLWIKAATPHGIFLARTNLPNQTRLSHVTLVSQPTIPGSRSQTPFAVTDYNEINLHGDIDVVLANLRYFMPLIWEAKLDSAEYARVFNSTMKCEIEMNPFMMPGPRTAGVRLHRMPEAVNGFTMIVTPSSRV